MRELEVTYIDKGHEERLLIDGEDVGRIDKLSTRQLLEKLKRHNVLILNVVSFDEYSES